MFLHHLTGYCKAEPVLTVSLSFPALHRLISPEPLYSDFYGTSERTLEGWGGRDDALLQDLAVLF